MISIYIYYNATGEIERWDTVDSKAKAHAVIQELIKFDQEAAKRGAPIMDCYYFIKEVDE